MFNLHRHVAFFGAACHWPMFVFLQKPFQILPNETLLFFSSRLPMMEEFLLTKISFLKILENMCTGSCKQKSEVPVGTMFTYIFDWFFSLKNSHNLVRENVFGPRDGFEYVKFRTRVFSTEEENFIVAFSHPFTRKCNVSCELWTRKTFSSAVREKKVESFPVKFLKNFNSSSTCTVSSLKRKN